MESQSNKEKNNPWNTNQQTQSRKMEHKATEKKSYMGNKTKVKHIGEKDSRDKIICGKQDKRETLYICRATQQRKPNIWNAT